jgi:transcriptional regulator with XRE-family HTH domain
VVWISLRKSQRRIGETVCGVSPSTLSRIEREETPDMAIFLRLCDWLYMPASEFLRESREQYRAIDRIEQALRSGGVLAEEIIDAVLTMLRTNGSHVFQSQDPEGGLDTSLFPARRPRYRLIDSIKIEYFLPACHQLLMQRLIGQRLHLVKVHPFFCTTLLKLLIVFIVFRKVPVVERVVPQIKIGKQNLLLRKLKLQANPLGASWQYSLARKSGRS